MASIKELTFDHLIGQEVGTAVLLGELARGGIHAGKRKERSGRKSR